MAGQILKSVPQEMRPPLSYIDVIDDITQEKVMKDYDPGHEVKKREHVVVVFGVAKLIKNPLEMRGVFHQPTW